MSDLFFDRPILNSPYEYPCRHWELDDEGQPTQCIIEERRSAKFISPIPKPKKRRAEQGQLVFDEGHGLSTAEQQYHASIINEVRRHVNQWRDLPVNAWQVTPETARLLQHWRQHDFGGTRPFFCQVEAVETAIWLTEAAPQTKAGKRFLDHLEAANRDANPDLSRLALKLATGAGKTTVMAMLIVWQTVNAVRRPGSKHFTRGFLIVAPGLTIRDRLRVLQPNDPDNYYAHRELVPTDMLEDLQRAKIVITNYHAFKLRERQELSAGGRALLKGRTGDDLQTTETEGQMIQRVMPDLIVCQNTAISKLVYDYVSGFFQKDQNGLPKLVNGRLALFRNFDEVTGNPLPYPNTLLIDSEQLEAGDALEIRFPRVEGYRVELPEERLTATFNADSILELTPDLTGPSITRNSGIIGQGVDLNLKHLGDVRPSTLLFHLTQRLLYTKWRDPGEEPKLHLFGQLKRITKEWLDTCLVCKGSTYPALLMYQELADMACNRITAGISQAFENKRPIKALLDPYNPTGSTLHVRFSTSRELRWDTKGPPPKNHVNWVVLDSDWEAEFCRVAEAHPKVMAYTKNHNLGLEVPYRYGSETRKYLPDFIVRVNDGRGPDDLLNLIVEIKGYRREDAKEKKITMEAHWIPGVNNLKSYGRWAFAEFTDIWEMETDFAQKVEAEFNKLIGSYTEQPREAHT